MKMIDICNSQAIYMTYNGKEFAIASFYLHLYYTIMGWGIQA